MFRGKSSSNSSTIILVIIWSLLKISHASHQQPTIPAAATTTSTTATVKCDRHGLEECDHSQDYLCYFDLERYCFKHFYTKCRVQAYVCRYETELVLYENKFCDLVQFLCNEEISEYRWPAEHFEQQIAAMYKKKNAKQQQQQQQQQQRNKLTSSAASTSWLPVIINSKTNNNLIK